MLSARTLRVAVVGCLEGDGATDRETKKTSEVRNPPKLVSFAGYCAVWEGLRYN